MNNNIENQENFKKKKKFRLIKNKKWVIGIVATSLLVGGGVRLNQIRKENVNRNGNKEYAVGYDGVNVFTNFVTKKVGENNFVLLNIKDHDSVSILFSKIQMEYCKNNGIDIGVIIDTDSSTLGDVYLDLEYLFGVMEEYKINYPVYLNVDSFFENDKLSSDMAESYIYSFLEKATLNNLYIGVMGDKKNLDGRFEGYDRLIINSIKDSEGRVFEENHIYYADKDLKGYIEENYLNYPGLFKDDGYYICNGNETLREIANKFGISVDDLLKFNDISEKEIEEGKIFRIPSLVQSYHDDLIYVEDSFYKGIDVSSWQGKINWDIVDVDYAIIRVRDFINEENDTEFKNNVIECSKNNIPMGFYSYSRATSVSDIKKEAQYILNQLRNVEVTYPVYLDLETDFWTFKIDSDGQKVLDGMTYSETREFVLEVLKMWEKSFGNSGYIPGVYCGEKLYKELNEISDGYINQLAVWVTDSTYYDKEINFNDKDNVPVVSVNSNIGMKQISSKGLLNGIYNESGSYVDINYCYVDYEKYRPYRFDRMNFSDYYCDINFEDSFLPFGVGIGAGIILDKVNRYRKVLKKKKEKR